MTDTVPANRKAMQPRLFKVGTFYRTSDGPLCVSRIQAYTVYYNPKWEGCLEIDVEATSGSEAKKIARHMRYDHEIALARD